MRTVSDSLVCEICGSVAESRRAAYLHNANLHGTYEAIDPSAFEKLAARQKLAATQRQQMVCPHCQTKGSVSTSRVNVKKGISGGKATGALLTGGFSLLVTGLSRKESATQANCRNCGMTWLI